MFFCLLASRRFHWPNLCLPLPASWIVHCLSSFDINAIWRLTSPFCECARRWRTINLHLACSTICWAGETTFIFELVCCIGLWSNGSIKPKVELLRDPPFCMVFYLNYSCADCTLLLSIVRSSESIFEDLEYNNSSRSTQEKNNTT